jgi:hypothetical protein
MVPWAHSPSFNRAVAQWLEQGTHNPPVVGSIPTGPTNSLTNILLLLHSKFTFRRWFLPASEKATSRPSCRMGDTKIHLHSQDLGH